MGQGGQGRLAVPCFWAAPGGSKRFCGEIPKIFWNASPKSGSPQDFHKSPSPVSASILWSPAGEGAARQEEAMGEGAAVLGADGLPDVEMAPFAGFQAGTGARLTIEMLA